MSTALTIARYVQQKTPGPLQSALKAPLAALASLECAIARAWVASAHKRKMLVEWGLPPYPEFFDHRIDLHYKWTADRNPLWLERGVFGGLAFPGDGDTLELSCGDGFNTKHFYSLRSRRVIACDIDPAVIRVARRQHAAPNVEYLVQDIRDGMPEGSFHNVVWDGTIEHLTRAEINAVLPMIGERIGKTGIHSGYTIVEPHEEKALSHHATFFKDKDDLAAILKAHFRNVTVFETVYPSRHNLYWWASHGAPLPFMEGWARVTR